MKRSRKKWVLAVQLPEEIIVEILCRLPVKMLGRCKCVCKLWNNLISNPNFILSPTGRERAIIHYTPNSQRADVRVDREYFYAIDDEFSVTKVPDAVGGIDRSYCEYLNFFGTANGLILLLRRSANFSLYLWNPSTGRCRFMPQLDLLAYEYRRIYIRAATGLCFDKVSNDYKAILVNYCSPGGTCVYVASLRKGGLSIYLNFPYKNFTVFNPCVLSSSSSGVLIHGHLHWFARRERVFTQLIIYFDEELNHFKELPLPEDNESGDLYYFGLTVLQGCLCLSRGVRGSIDDDNDVFIMRDYGERHSWTKLLTVRGLLVPLQPRISNKIVLVLRSNRLLYTYNLETKDFKRIKCPPSDMRREIRYNLRNKPDKGIPLVATLTSGPFMFMESLASVDLI